MTAESTSLVCIKLFNMNAYPNDEGLDICNLDTLCRACDSILELGFALIRDVTTGWISRIY
jgi:hypothetical protein